VEVQWRHGEGRREGTASAAVLPDYPDGQIINKTRERSNAATGGAAAYWAVEMRGCQTRASATELDLEPWPIGGESHYPQSQRSVIT